MPPDSPIPDREAVRALIARLEAAPIANAQTLDCRAEQFWAATAPVPALALCLALCHALLASLDAEPPLPEGGETMETSRHAACRTPGRSRLTPWRPIPAIHTATYRRLLIPERIGNMPGPHLEPPMPSRRFARAETIADHRALLEAMRACRDQAILAARPLRPTGAAAAELNLLTAAIDRLAEHLTGNPRLFHAGGSVAPAGMLNGVRLERE